MRKSLMKSIFLTFFSLCFLCVGVVTLFAKEENNIASAETVVVDGLENNIPDYVSIAEFETVDSETALENSLINDNTFLYHTNSTGHSNKLTISLKTNGRTVNAGGADIYQYVYYPNSEDLSTFYFYTIESTNLYINGVAQSIPAEKEFSYNTQQSFENESGAYLETYELNFANTNSSYYTDNETELNRTISLTDAEGNLIQGRYTVDITLTLWTCTDGRSDGMEENFYSNTVNLRYEFLVLDRSEYITNSRPVLTASNFDSSYQVTSAQSDVYGYYYYFNYSYANNKIASVTYDPTKYDVDITKTLNSDVTSMNVSYIQENAIGDNDGITITGEEIVTYVKNANNSITLYFADVGNYSLIFNAVATFSYTQDGSTINNKYSLSALTDSLKRIMVYGYGYQANYVDYDNNSEYAEFKSYLNEAGVFDGRYYNSADITSEFLASNSSFGQNSTTTDTKGNTTFTINNVLGYVNQKLSTISEDESFPIATNQSPVRFVSNSTIASGNISSYVYSTTQVNNSYSQTSLTLDGSTLYRSTYTGGSISEKGKYIFILAYTFNNFYTTSGQLAQNIYFYQVFFFEITGEPPIVNLYEAEDVEATSNAIYSNTFTNKDVIIINPNLLDVHNKDVTVQIYAQDYNTNTYLSSYGGTLGINMLSAPGYDGGNTLILSENAHYTIRLYYTNEMSTITTDINEMNSSIREKIKRQYYFTIDKQEIDGVTARNVSLISGTTNYDILQDLDGVSTNQDFIISWNEKASTAPTYAYYRFFPIVESDYYTGTDEETSTLLYQFLNLRSSDFLPINYALNLFEEENKNTWIRYVENTENYNLTTPSQNVLTSRGLYIFDIYDAAGNHTYQIYIKDTTSPIFALETNGTYSLIPSSYFISENSTLYWGDYKAIQINRGSQNWSFNVAIDDINNIDPSLYNYNLFWDRNNSPNSGIFREFYEALYRENVLQYIASPNDSMGVYLTIGIDDITYQTPIGSNDYQMVENENSFELTTETGNNMGYIYNVLIRDESNKRYVTGTDFNDESEKYSFNQYASHFSARQTIIVSFDDSEFKIYYTDSQNSQITLDSNNKVEDSITIGEGDNQKTYSTLTTYLSPVNLDETFNISFIPTITDETTSLIVQVDTVTIEYYAYEQKRYEHRNEAGEVESYSYYYSISDTVTSRDTIYSYASDGQSQTEFYYEIMPNSDLITSPGKYVITRTYSTDDNFTINDRDYYSRTFVLYVDRNEVISRPTQVKDENGNTISESLVGGEIFVGMYDSGNTADIVVTFPTNSVAGSSQGETTLYNGNTTNSIWTTNKLPVKIYVPTYKYTMYAIQVPNDATEDPDDYYYQVVNSISDNFYSDGDSYYLDENDEPVVIDEYLIYAEIYKDYATSEIDERQAIYTTASTSVNGFLTFYDNEGQPLDYLTEEGVYTIMIYQGYNSVAEVTGESFKQVAAFTFTIENVLPNFTARTQTGRALNSDTVLNSSTRQTIERYHTNQDSVQILWDKPDDTDIFKAEIDQSNITISLTSNGSVLQSQVIDANTLFNNQIEESGNYYIGTLTFSNLLGRNFYQNGNYIDITMQFLNHNDAYYETVTKRIIIDTQAPYINIENLVYNVIGNVYNADLISYEDLRTKSNISRENVSLNSETTYNTSTQSGTFRYFSYSVNGETFLNTLKTTALTEASSIYYRLFNNKYTTATSYETTPDAFLESNFSNINSLNSFEVGSYYEIVESDLAGNLTIYTIYVVDYSSNDEAIISYEVNDNGEIIEDSITQNDYNDALSITNHTARLNIYTKPGLEITGINYFGNVWTNFIVNETNENGITTTTYYFTSPWLGDRIYRIDGEEFNEVDVSTIFDGSRNSRYKSSISFYDTVLGGQTNIYLNTRNTTLSATLTSEQSREYITFTTPTNAELESTTTAYPYLTKIKIYTPASDATGTAEVVYYSDEFENPFGYSDLWQSSQDVIVTYTATTLTFELNPNLNLVDNTRIVYEFTDNYGTTYTEIHLYNETTGYQEISSGNTLYSFYAEDNNLYYITSDNFRYTYNEAKYSVRQYQYEDAGWVEITEENSFVVLPNRTTNSNSIVTLTYDVRDGAINYSYRFRLDIYDTARVDANDPPVKSVYFILNNEIPLPETETMENINNEFYFTSNGRIVTESILGLNDVNQVDYYSRVTLNFRTNTSFLPVKFEISTDGVIWSEIESGTEISCPEDIEQQEYYLRVWYDLDEIRNLGYIDQTGNHSYIFEVIPPSSVYNFRLSSTLTTAYYVTLQRGDAVEIVEKSGQTYTTPGTSNRRVFANHYIVNINYADRDSYLDIITNAEQLIEWREESVFYQDAENVRTYIYTISNLNNIVGITNIPRFDTQIAITYIEPTNQFTSEFYTYNSAGIIDTNANLISSSSLDYIVPESSSITQLKLRWSKYYAIEQNVIEIHITKNGHELNPVIYSETVNGRDYYYTYITRSGRYRISFEDTAGNVQIFNYGNIAQTESFTLTFLKDIPFTVTYTNPITDTEETTEPISEAIYNGTIVLRLDTNTSSYYTAEGVSLSVTRNGTEYTGYSLTDGAYTFTETGYYGVTFSAVSSRDETNIRSQTYYFTILNPNEYRYSFIINKYSNYYIQSIEKDGVDMTDVYIRSLNLDTIVVDQKTYLAELTLSYLDEKTGAGTYIITVNSNEKLYNSDSTQTSWTFQVTIQVGRENLIYTSINAGESTTSPITVQFNAENIYDEFGESTLQIIYYNDNSVQTEYSYSVNALSTGVQSYTIEDTNEYFIQLVSPSGNLLYSAKVTKNEPFNAATIIAIVVSVLVVLVVIILIIVLRKRISVK